AWRRGSSLQPREAVHPPARPDPWRSAARRTGPTCEWSLLESAWAFDTNETAHLQATVSWIRRRLRYRRPFPLCLLLLGLAVSGCAPGAEQRRAAVYALRAEPSEKNIGRLRELLADPDRDVRATALTLLVEL